MLHFISVLFMGITAVLITLPSMCQSGYNFSEVFCGVVVGVAFFSLSSDAAPHTTRGSPDVHTVSALPQCFPRADGDMGHGRGNLSPEQQICDFHQCQREPVVTWHTEETSCCVCIPQLPGAQWTVRTLSCGQLSLAEACRQPFTEEERRSSHLDPVTCSPAVRKTEHRCMGKCRSIAHNRK